VLDHGDVVGDHSLREDTIGIGTPLEAASHSRLDRRLRDVEGCVGRTMREVGDKRLLAPVGLHELDHVVRDRPHLLVVAIGQAGAHPVEAVVVEELEAVLSQHPIATVGTAEVPFATHAGRVTRIPQHLEDGVDRRIQALGATG
jgi:hypothetical protein